MHVRHDIVICTTQNRQKFSTLKTALNVLSIALDLLLGKQQRLRLIDRRSNQRAVSGVYSTHA